MKEGKEGSERKGRKKTMAKFKPKTTTFKCQSATVLPLVVNNGFVPTCLPYLIVASVMAQDLSCLVLHLLT